MGRHDECSRVLLSCAATGGRGFRAIPISIMMPDPVPERAVVAAGWLLPVLLPAERRQVEVVVRAVEQIGAARVGRVGVEHAVAIAQEDAQAVLFALREIALTLLHELRFVPV